MVSRARGTLATMVDNYQARLAEAMKDASMDVSALARAIGVSYQAAKKVLDGGSKSMSAANNAKAAVALGVSSDWLASGAGPKRQALADAAAPATWPFDVPFERYMALDAGQRSDINDLVGHLVTVFEKKNNIQHSQETASPNTEGQEQVRRRRRERLVDSASLLIQKGVKRS